MVARHQVCRIAAHKDVVVVGIRRAHCDVLLHQEGPSSFYLGVGEFAPPPQSRPTLP